MSITVNNQKDLDKAIADKADAIFIDSPAGVWLSVGGNGQVVSSSVEARGSSSVEARGSSRVVARESSSVVARESSSVEAWESSSVEARGSSSVEAWESSSVEARGSSSVVAWESSSVEARGSSSVVARGSSRVVAWESSRVVAWESSSVEAWESSRVVAWESSRVVASKFVSVHLHSQKATVAGGVLIDLTKIDLTTSKDWLDYHGVKVNEDGRALLYKAVDNEWHTPRGSEWTYAPGNFVEAKDFIPTKECGKGLHFGVSPRHSKNFFDDATRFVAVLVSADDLIPLDDKAKAPNCTVLYEVDIDGDQIVPVKSETEIKIEQLEKELNELKASTISPKAGE